MKTYLESIQRFDSSTQAWLISEAPHAAHGLRSSVLPQLQFLVGKGVDFGFENLGLDREQQDKLKQAFITDGVRLPDTTCRLRYGTNPEGALIEEGPAEISLPEYWLQGVLASHDNAYVWIGKRVRPEQIGVVDLSLYESLPDGHQLRDKKR